MLYLKRDPIEQDYRFRHKFEKAKSLANALLEEVNYKPDMHDPRERTWAALKDVLLKEYGIKWSSPLDLNPWLRNK